MPTLSFGDWLNIEFWEYQSAYCHNSYNEEVSAKKIGTKNNHSIILTHYSHIQVWLAVWHLQQWCFVRYLTFESAVVQIKFRVTLLCRQVFRGYSELTSFISTEFRCIVFHTQCIYQVSRWILFKHLIYIFTLFWCADSELSVHSF